MENRDTPAVVVRRRRKVNSRVQRESTPEGSKLGKNNRYSDDDEEESTSSGMRNSSSRTSSARSSQVSAHRSKILNRRDKTVATSAQRSLSQPKIENETQTLDVQSLLRVARRSLSSPRHKEESSDTSPAQTLQRSPPPAKPREKTPPVAVSHQVSKLEQNLKRFEEERRKFEKEKKKFEQERKELDRLRLRKLEEHDRKRIAEGYQQLIALRSLEPRRSSTKISDPEEKQSLIESFNKAQEISLKKKQRTISPSPAKDKTPTPEIFSPPDVVIVTEKDIRRSISLREDRPSVYQDDESSTLTTSGEDDADDECGQVKSSTNLRQRVTANGSNQLPQLAQDQTTDQETRERTPKLSWFSRFFKKKAVINDRKKNGDQKDVKDAIDKRGMKITKWQQWKAFKASKPHDIKEMKKVWNRCVAHLIILVIFCGIGGLIFRFVEGAFENYYKCGVKRVKRDFVDSLWVSSHNLREEDWKSLARVKLRKFEEELQLAFEAGMTSYSGQKAWSFLNSWVYCFSVVTTIGYGHIAPVTTTGRAITIIYSIIGIPIFLILLADFGKLFTRGIKFLWAYVRGLYYTGSCRKVRKTVQVQDMMRGFDIAYDFVRRPSHFLSSDQTENEEADAEAGAEPSATHLSSQSLALPPNSGSGPQTPMPSEIEIDDEFNLPISLALFILISYILFGAVMYSTWETWTFFESFYFVFISMSTIGFGDYVPNHPMFMMASIVYLVFGLALTSMCINVVQLKLSDSFRQASAKIRETIGLSEEAARSSQSGSGPTSPELASVHSDSTVKAAVKDNNGLKPEKDAPK